ncbi:MAG TPA: hypothetical protein VEB68_01575 [Croceibacterium sp.]|nr:hypothetical protein [Croceibacterium sp.]
MTKLVTAALLGAAVALTGCGDGTQEAETDAMAPADEATADSAMPAADDTPAADTPTEAMPDEPAADTATDDAVASGDGSEY